MWDILAALANRSDLKWTSISEIVNEIFFLLLLTFVGSWRSWLLLAFVIRIKFETEVRLFQFLYRFICYIFYFPLSISSFISPICWTVIIKYSFFLVKVRFIHNFNRWIFDKLLLISKFQKRRRPFANKVLIIMRVLNKQNLFANEISVYFVQNKYCG